MNKKEKRKKNERKWSSLTMKEIENIRKKRKTSRKTENIQKKEFEKENEKKWENTLLKKEREKYS